MTASSGSFESHPDQLNALIQTFQGSPSLQLGSPFQGQGVRHQVLTTNQDKAEEQRAQKGLIQYILPDMGVEIDVARAKVISSRVTPPKTTRLFGEIRDQPVQSRAETFADSFMAKMKETNRSDENVLNPLANQSLLCMTLDMAKALLSGKYPTSTLTSIYDKKELNASCCAAMFLPHDLTCPIFARHYREEKLARSGAHATGSADKPPAELRVIVTKLDNLQINSSMKLLINALGIRRTLVDYAEMEKDLPSMFNRLAVELIKFFKVQEDQKVGPWEAAVHPQDALRYLFFSLCDQLMVHVGEYAMSPTNRDIYANKGDLTTLDFSAIERFLEIFNMTKKNLELLQATDSPLTSLPAIYTSLRHVRSPASQPADEASRQPPASDSRQQPRAGRRQESPSESRQHSGSERRQEVPPQRASKKQRTQPTGTPGANGILILHSGSSLNEALPPGSNACPEFNVRGHTCPEGSNCTKSHWATLSEVPSRQRIVMTSHMRSSGKAYINQWKLGNGLNRDDPEFQDIIGSPNYPPTRA